jgi:hypothetical protein
VPRSLSILPINPKPYTLKKRMYAPVYSVQVLRKHSLSPTTPFSFSCVWIVGSQAGLRGTLNSFGALTR